MLWLPRTAWACAACTGQTDDRMAQGMNAGILCMLAILGAVLLSFAGFAIYLLRKSAASAALHVQPKAN